MLEGLEHHSRLLALAAMGLVLCGCGNGKGDAASTEVSVEGSWSGTYAPAGATYSKPVYALIRKGGTAFFYDDDGIMYRMPVLNGAYSFSGSVKAFAPIGYRFTDLAPASRYSIRGAAADSEITGELRNSSGAGELDLTPFDIFPGRSAVAAGQWSGYYITPTPYFVSLDVDAHGDITGNDVFGCRLSGRIRQPSAGENLFEVTIATTGPKPVCGETFNGLAHEADYDTFGYFKHEPGTYFYVGATAASSAFAAEFKVN